MVLPAQRLQLLQLHLSVTHAIGAHEELLALRVEERQKGFDGLILFVARGKHALWVGRTTSHTQ